MMDLVFCGTPMFAVPTLEKLVAAGFRVKLVVTQPDRPSGRGMELAASPVKRVRPGTRSPSHPTGEDQEQRRIPPTTGKHRARGNHRRRLRPHHPAVDDRPARRWATSTCTDRSCRNIAARRRSSGRSLCGETITGVTTMRIDAGLDTGDILQQVEERILPEDTAVTLAPRLAQAGAELMISTLAGLANGSITPQPQDNLQATLAPILKREDGMIDFARTATDTWNRLRGFQPWPGAFTKLSRQRTARSRRRARARRHHRSRRTFHRRQRAPAAGLRARHRAGNSGASGGREKADDRAGFHQRLPAEGG